MADLDVIIPVRDVDAYLGDALQTVFEQSLDVAVVVVDAGSVTRIALPPQFASRTDVTLVRSEEPLTAGGGRNLGAALGTARWMSFLDADDLWTPGSHARLIEAAVAASADLGVGMVTHFHADDAARRLALPEGEKVAMLASGVVVSREAWARVGPFDPVLRTGEFVEWMNRFTHSGHRFAQVDEVVLRRRLHLASTTAGQIADRSDYLEVVRRWMNRNG